MILTCIFFAWLLVGFGLLRTINTFNADDEFIENSDVQVRWYYHFPLWGFILIVFIVVFGSFALLSGIFTGDRLLDEFVKFVAKLILVDYDGLFIAPHLRLFFGGTLFFLLMFICILTTYFLYSIIRKFFPHYYYFSCKKNGQDAPPSNHISNKHRVILPVVLCITGYYYSFPLLIALLLVLPLVILFLYLAERFWIYIGVKREPNHIRKNLLSSAMKQWFLLGAVFFISIIIVPVYVLTDKSIVVSRFYRVSQISWSDIVDLKIRVRQDLAEVDFNENPYLVSVNANVNSGPNLELYTLENKDILVKILEIFQSKGIPVKCKADSNLKTALTKTDMSKLGNSGTSKYEILKYIDETCNAGNLKSS